MVVNFKISNRCTILLGQHRSVRSTFFLLSLIFGCCNGRRPRNVLRKVKLPGYFVHRIIHLWMDRLLSRLWVDGLLSRLWIDGLLSRLWVDRLLSRLWASLNTFKCKLHQGFIVGSWFRLRCARGSNVNWLLMPWSGSREIHLFRSTWKQQQIIKRVSFSHSHSLFCAVRLAVLKSVSSGIHGLCM